MTSREQKKISSLQFGTTESNPHFAESFEEINYFFKAPCMGTSIEKYKTAEIED